MSATRESAPSLVLCRSENKYHVALESVREVVSILEQVGIPVAYVGERPSRVISAYYASPRTASCGDLSIRLRSYLIEGYNVHDQPAVLDVKYESESTVQSKSRRSMTTWMAGHELLSSGNEWMFEMLPETAAKLGPIGPLAAEFGVEYLRHYFLLPGDVRVTVDDCIRPLKIDDQCRLTAGIRVPAAVVEVKYPPEASSKEWNYVLELLGPRLMKRPPSKRTIAKAALKTWGEQC